MKKITGWLIFVPIACLVAGCLINERRLVTPLPTPWVITVVVTAPPLPTMPRSPTITPGEGQGPIAIATALRVVPTQEPTATPTALPSRTPTDSPQRVCPDTYPSFLRVEMTATILPSAERNIIRKDPGLSAEDALMRLSPGEMISILEGPECEDNMVWWKVQSLDNPNKKGWTSEGGDGEYWMTPAPGFPTPAPTATPTSAHSITPTKMPTPLPKEDREPTPVPDYTPGRGMAVLEGDSPYELTILRGGWQAYQIGASADQWGYLVDITPLQPSVEGAYVEYKILPEYSNKQWVDVLWLRAPGIQDSLPVRLDLIPTKGWTVKFEADVRLNPGDWMGFSMFSNEEGCGGVLDISPANTTQLTGATIYNTRVQPEYPGNWVQVARVQLSSEAVAQQAWLRYYAPGSSGQEVLRQEASLPADEWSGWVVADSEASQGYVVEVMPLRTKDNEVAFSFVRPEFNGTKWEDVLRVYVPAGRPVLEALLRVLAVPVK